MRGVGQWGLVAAGAVALALAGVVWRGGGDAPAGGGARPSRATQAPSATPAASDAKDARDVEIESVEAPPPVVEPAPRPPVERFADFEAELAPGTLEVLVLDARRPLEGATVRLRETRTGELFETRVPGEDERVAFSDSDGFARFAAVEAAHYMVGVQTRDGRLVTTYQMIKAGKPTSRQIVALGSGGVSGVVRALDGTPLANSRVLLGVVPPERAPRVCVVGQTDAEGRYTLAGVHEGRGRVYCELGRAIDVELAQSGWQEANFGSATPAVTWRGAVRGRSGAPCLAVERVVATELGDGESYVAEVTASGAFELALPPGSYRAWGSASADPPVDFGAIELALELAGQSFASDLTVPGVTLAGRIVGVGDGAAGTHVTLTVERAGDAASRRKLTLVVGDSYVFPALEPGVWLVTTPPLELLGARGRVLEIKLDDKRDRATLDLLVSRR